MEIFQSGIIIKSAFIKMFKNSNKKNDRKRI